MRVDFVTLFPEMVLAAARHSILARAEERGLVRFGASNPRDFASGVHRAVDDSPYGGGPGMVMRADLVASAVSHLNPEPGSAIAFLDPTGERFDQAQARDLAMRPSLVLVCGHYEGIDERACLALATHRLSIGDFVLTGGELAALVVADAVVRLIPGVLGSIDSLAEDSHASGLLAYPQYTRPEVWNGLATPPVLLSGHHDRIQRWRRAQALRVTRERRPDLLARAPLTQADVDLLREDPE
jgi:tRNA (guanine37-N1)-methyltransferase